jgi:hypothetical protein
VAQTFDLAHALREISHGLHSRLIGQAQPIPVRELNIAEGEASLSNILLRVQVELEEAKVVLESLYKAVQNG